jgi:hypothetical protein
MGTEERLDAIQDLEYSEAGAQGRASAVVVSGQMPENYMGEYNEDLNQIKINDDMLRSDTPDECLRTYFHEERHAYQHSQANIPAVADDPVKAAQWAENFKDGNYITPEENFAAYMRQPVEADANEYSEQRFAEYESQTQTQGRSASAESQDPGQNTGVDAAESYSEGYGAGQ